MLAVVTSCNVFAVVACVLAVVACVLAVVATVALCVVDVEVKLVVSRVVVGSIDNIVVGVSVSEFIELHILVSEVEK